MESEPKCSPCGDPPRRRVRLAPSPPIVIPFYHLSVESESDLSGTDILPLLDQDISAVDVAVTEEWLTLESLEQQRDALENIKHGDIIPIQHRIPPEIWTEIFLYGHLLDSEDDFFDWPYRIIWQLSQVCQAWRNLAFSLHSCWSSIVLEFSVEWRASEADLEILVFVLERSHQHLLDITLVNSNRKNGDLPFAHRMREKVFAESHRWRTARLADYHQLRPDLLYAPLRGRLPQLVLLDFESSPGDHAISAFKDCPRLVNVGLIGTDARMVELPVKQITCLRLSDNWGSHNVEAYGDLVTQCSSLASLRVDSLNTYTRNLPPPPRTHPRLRDLSVTYPRFLDSLTLPRLEVAAFDPRVPDLNPETLYSFYHLIQRSDCACNLIELRIIRVPLTLHSSEPHLLLSILSQTTKLATLQLEASMLHFQHKSPDDWSITQVMDVMRALEVVPGHTVAFLPRLVSLDIEVTDHTDMGYIPYLTPFDDFVAMLKARRAGNEYGFPKLEQFSFSLRTTYRGDHHPATYHDRPVFDDYEIAVLRGLVGDGMSLNIHFEGVLRFDL